MEAAQSLHLTENCDCRRYRDLFTGIKSRIRSRNFRHARISLRAHRTPRGFYIQKFRSWVEIIMLKVAREIFNIECAKCTYVYVRACVCVCMCVRACVRACARGNAYPYSTNNGHWWETKNAWSDWKTLSWNNQFDRSIASVYRDSRSKGERDIVSIKSKTQTYVTRVRITLERESDYRGRIAR